MNLEAILSEIKEFGAECVWKNREECLTAPDSIILAYLKTLVGEKEFEIILRYKDLMIEKFRRSVKEELDFLNDRP